MLLLTREVVPLGMWPVQWGSVGRGRPYNQGCWCLGVWMLSDLDHSRSPEGMLQCREGCRFKVRNWVVALWGTPDPREVWEVKILASGEQMQLEAYGGHGGGGGEGAHLSQSTAPSQTQEGQLETTGRPAGTADCRLCTRTVLSRATVSLCPEGVLVRWGGEAVSQRKRLQALTRARAHKTWSESAQPTGVAVGDGETS